MASSSMTITQSIHSRLQDAEALFLRAVASGPSAVKAFEESWVQLQTDLDEACKTAPLGEPTLTLAQITATNIALLADNFLQTQTQYDQISAQLLDEVDAIFANISLVDSNTPRTSPCPPYIKTSCTWLLENLHDPYPPSDIRNRIAVESGCPRKDIDGWFTEARKRIGWTRLRKAAFDNKRSGIVDAAKRFFVEADPKRPLPSHINIAFASILTAASELFHGRFSETPLAMGLNTLIRDVRQQKTQRMIQHTLSTSSHPSLKPIPRYSPDTLTLGLEVTDHNTTRGKKRSYSPPSDETVHKRRRRDQALHETAPCSSPAISSPADIPTPDSNSLTTSPTLTIPPKRRKRRLSESDTSPGPKRPCNLPIGQRSSAVSNPFPMPAVAAEAVVDEWLKFGGTSFDIPHVTIDEPDSSEPLDIALFDFSEMLPAYVHSSSSEGSLNSTPITPEQFLPSDGVNRPHAEKNVDISSGFPDLQTGGNTFSLPIPLEFCEDDFCLTDYSIMEPLFPTNFTPQPSPLTAFNFLRPEPTPLPSPSIPWDWYTLDASFINPAQQAPSTLPSILQELPAPV